MIIKEKIGNLKDIRTENREIDKVCLEWYETGKRILHKTTTRGKEVIMKFLNGNPNLLQDDVLYEDENSLILIDIQPCEVIIVYPGSMYSMAKLCYEIGNKHLPIFYEENAVLIPYDPPLFKWLMAAGFAPVRKNRKLLHQLRTTVSAHVHDSSNSLFSKILKLTSSAND